MPNGWLETKERSFAETPLSHVSDDPWLHVNRALVKIRLVDLNASPACGEDLGL